MQKLTLTCDGGMHGKNPGGILYGSYRFEDQQRTLEYGVQGTSNESEYVALLHGLNAVIQHYGNVQDVALTVKTDSELVRQQVHGRWRVRAENLWWLRYAAVMLLENFGDWHIQHVPRREIVAVLGH